MEDHQGKLEAFFQAATKQERGDDLTERTADETELTDVKSWHDTSNHRLLQPIKKYSASEVTDTTINESEESKTDEDWGSQRHIDCKNLKRHKILGEGAFGQVWLVSDADEQPYALKVFSKYDLIVEKQVETVLRERHIMSQLSHPFLCQLLSADQDANLIYMLLDFHAGGELYSVIERHQGPLPEKQVVFYTACIADALYYMHGRNIVYRDLKPENVVIDMSGYSVLVDFSYARRMIGDKAYTLCGSPRFASPEMIEGIGHSFSTDHWSLGILLYEMITGESPFYYEGTDEAALYRSIVEDEYKSPVGASESAVDIISRLLVKDPNGRFGCKGDGEILRHAWFRNFDVVALRNREIQSPWVPFLAHDLDTRYFDNWDDLNDKVEERHPKLLAAEAALFDEF